MINIGGTEENLRIRVTTNREKAVGASQIRKTLIDMGESNEFASDIAGHEIKHALAHKGSGYMGVRSNDFFVEGYYSPEEPEKLTSEEKRRITEAVGKDEMSQQDKKHSK